jgi:hypothetical protein
VAIRVIACAPWIDGGAGPARAPLPAPDVVTAAEPVDPGPLPESIGDGGCHRPPESCQNVSPGGATAVYRVRPPPAGPRPHALALAHALAHAHAHAPLPVPWYTLF